MRSWQGRVRTGTGTVTSIQAQQTHTHTHITPPLPSPIFPWPCKANPSSPVMNKIVVTRTKAAITRLRAYKPPPFPLWDKLPLSRRAAVLILLYADRHGDLRVVLTMRAASLRSFSGP